MFSTQEQIDGQYSCPFSYCATVVTERSLDIYFDVVFVLCKSKHLKILNRRFCCVCHHLKSVEMSMLKLNGYENENLACNQCGHSSI